MYNLEAIKVELIVNGKKVKYDVPLDYYNLSYEDLFSSLLEIVNQAANYLDEEIYEVIQVSPFYGSDMYE